jgi:hypothetical protein
MARRLRFASLKRRQRIVAIVTGAYRDCNASKKGQGKKE